MGDRSPRKGRIARRKARDAYGSEEDTFVGVYLAAIELEAYIEDGPLNALGSPLLSHEDQQSLF